MCNFAKAYSVCVIGIIALGFALAVAYVFIQVFRFGDDAGLFGIDRSSLGFFLFVALYWFVVNGGILIFLGLPFYALVSKFMRLGLVSCTILGVLVGFLNRYFVVSLFHVGPFSENLAYYIAAGTLFGIMLGIVYGFFNRPLSDVQKVNWQIYNKNR